MLARLPDADFLNLPIASKVAAGRWSGGGGWKERFVSLLLFLVVGGSCF